MSRPPWGKGDRASSGRGGTCLQVKTAPQPRCKLYHSPTSANGAPKSRPPWGKVAGVSLTEGGNLLTSEDCPPTNAPTTTVQLTRTTHARPYNSASELPPTEP